MSYKIPMQVAEIQLTYKNKTRAKDRPQVSSSKEAYWVLESNWSDQMSLLEEFHILLLDQANRAMGMYCVSKGGVSSTVVDLRIIFAAAIKARAAAIVLAHNHPSGQLRPSHHDIELTNKIIKAGDLLDIVVQDHLILSPDGQYFSFADECLIP